METPAKQFVGVSFLEDSFIRYGSEYPNRSLCNRDHEGIMTLCLMTLHSEAIQPLIR